MDPLGTSQLPSCIPMNNPAESPQKSTVGFRVYVLGSLESRYDPEDQRPRKRSTSMSPSTRLSANFASLRRRGSPDEVFRV